MKALLLALALTGVAAGPLEAQSGAARIQGIVFDSTEMSVLDGARVAVLGTSSVTEADGDGHFALTGVPEGTWWVSFFHPRLQVLGVSPPSQQVTVRPSTNLNLDLSIPSESTLLMNWCMAEQPGPGFAAIAGVVRDSLTGVPMPRAVVRAEPVDRAMRSMAVEVRTDEVGYYRMCAVPAGQELRIQAMFGTSAGRTRFAQVPERGARVEDLMLLMTAAGTLAGEIVDYQTGQALAGVAVSVVGTESTTLTDPEGEFILDALPPGRHLVVTEGLGYETRTDSVTIFSQEIVDIRVQLATEALEVEGLVVTARSRFGKRTSLAADAKRADFITRADIEPLLPRVSHAGDLLRFMNIPGLSIREVQVADPSGATFPGLCVEVSRRFGGEACQMASVYLNDVHMPFPDQILRELDPNIIERIEVLSPIDAQFQFGSVASYGAIAIYTR